MEPNSIRVLVVDDEEHTRLGYAEVLRLEGYIVDIAENGNEGVEKLKKKDYDVIVTDLRMPEMDGIAFIEKVNFLCDNPKVIIITAFGSFKTYKKTKELGVTLFLNKPVRAKDLKEAVQQVMKM